MPEEGSDDSEEGPPRGRQARPRSRYLRSIEERFGEWMVAMMTRCLATRLNPEDLAQLLPTYSMMQFVGKLHEVEEE